MPAPSPWRVSRNPRPNGPGYTWYRNVKVSAGVELRLLLVQGNRGGAAVAALQGSEWLTDPEWVNLPGTQAAAALAVNAAIDGRPLRSALGRAAQASWADVLAGLPRFDRRRRPDPPPPPEPPPAPTCGPLPAGWRRNKDGQVWRMGEVCGARGCRLTVIADNAAVLGNITRADGSVLLPWVTLGVTDLADGAAEMDATVAAA